MLSDYLQAAMRLAEYEILPDDEGFYGESPALAGVWANALPLDMCRSELQTALEGWVVLGLRLGHVLPVLDGINLNTPLVAEAV